MLLMTPESYNPCFSSFDTGWSKQNHHEKMVTRAHLVQPETVSPLKFETKRMHLDQLCRTKTELCGVTHHTGLFLLRCTYSQPPNTELPTGFLLQQPLEQKTITSLTSFFLSLKRLCIVFWYNHSDSSALRPLYNLCHNQKWQFVSLSSSPNI